MSTLVIFGAGGHGRDIAWSARRAGWTVLGFLDDNLTGPEILGPWSAFSKVYGYSLIGLNSSQARAELDQGWQAGQIYDPSAVVSRDVRAAPGVVVGPQVSIGPNVTLGRHTHIGAGCTVTRASLGDYVTLAPGVDVAGDVMIGDRVQIGLGAKICNFVAVGDDAVIGAGAVVPPNTEVPAGVTVVGVPAKPLVRS